MRSRRVKIIVEIGVNHNGSLPLAKELIASAKDAGADYVKFQTFQTEAGICRVAPKASYQIARTPASESQWQMLKRLELDKQSHHELVQSSRDNGISFLSTACDLPSVDLLEELNISPIKIASCDLINLPLLRAINKLNVDVLLSTGMATEAEIDRAVQELSGVKSLALFLCTTEYPCPNAEVNLEKLRSLARWKRPLGFSDHTVGLAATVASIALGVEYIERHFTLDKSMPGPDHAASLEPNELRQLVQMVHEASDSMGNAELIPTESEIKNRHLMRRRIVAIKTIKKGEVITIKKVGMKRASQGRFADEIDSIVGTVASRSYRCDEAIE